MKRICMLFISLLLVFLMLLSACGRTDVQGEQGEQSSASEQSEQSEQTEQENPSEDHSQGTVKHHYGADLICDDCGHKAKVSVLGDGVSTYAKKIGVENPVYPNDTVKSEADTWWNQVISTLGGYVLRVNASGGSRILSDEYYNGEEIRYGNSATYRDRCDDLHIGSHRPDVIFVFMGTNDFSYTVDRTCEKCKLLLSCTECSSREDGNLNICDACRAASGDSSSFCTLPLGTADGADASKDTPTSVCEAYAIMLRKIQAEYPDASVYCLGLLPRISTDPSETYYHDHGQPTVFNAQLRKVAENAGVTFIDLEQCLDHRAETWSTYFTDEIHPTAIGMDQISQAVIAGMVGKEVYTVITEMDGGVTMSGQALAISGEAYQADVAYSGEIKDYYRLDVQVTMHGMDITESAFDAQEGRIYIDRVTGDIAITAKKVLSPKTLSSYLWVNTGNALESDTSRGDALNALSLTKGSVSNGVCNGVIYDIDQDIILMHDQQWGLEISISQWTSTNGVTPLGSSTVSTDGQHYLYFRPTDNFVGFGYFDGKNYQNYGISLTSYGIRIKNETHVYRLVNCVNQDGSNVIKLLVDDTYIGTLTNHYINSAFTDTENMGLSGQDFILTNMGTTVFPVNHCVINYIRVAEQGEHIHEWSDWQMIREPSPHAVGMDARTCGTCDAIQTREVEGVWQVYDLDAHWSDLPEQLCSNTNLWESLEHDPYYYQSGERWAIHESGTVFSVTIPVSAGDQIYATSFGTKATNGNTISSGNGIRVTFFGENGVLLTLSPEQTYAQFVKNGGYLIAPEGAIAVNVPMYGQENQELYLLNKQHSYTASPEGYTCACGASYKENESPKNTPDFSGV